MTENTSDCLTKRLAINYNIFNQSPVRSIKQLIGQNSTLISYRVNSVVNWSGEVYVDLVYKTIPIDLFTIYYIPMNEIKHLMPNSEKYITTVNGCNVKLNNPRLNSFHDYLPIRVKRGLLITDDNDDYEQYYASALNDDNLFEQKTSLTNVSNVANYFGTTVSNPMNSLITPLSLLIENNNNHFTSVGFTMTLPDVLYPKDFKAESVYSIDDTLRYYRQAIASIPALQLIDDIQYIKDFKEIVNEEDKQTTTAYIMSVKNLPDHGISGTIMIQPKRQVDLILYYPTNTYQIDVDELNSIKLFVEADEINYNNFQWLKKK